MDSLSPGGEEMLAELGVGLGGEDSSILLQASFPHSAATSEQGQIIHCECAQE